MAPTLTIALIRSSRFAPPLPLKTSRNSLWVEMNLKKKASIAFRARRKSLAPYKAEAEFEHFHREK